MKLKELLPSIYHTVKLLLLGTKKIKAASNSFQVVVSLTTIPYRLGKVHITIRSILVQDTPPEKIILWLHKDLQNSIPNSLKKLEGDIFEIRFSEISCPHLKLVETLKLYNNKPIVTCDDDMIYPSHWLPTLYKAHIEHSATVIANFTRQITYNKEGVINPYKTWHYNHGEDTEKLVPLGVGGVLYPPNSLYKEATNTKLFLTLCPKADDLWFKAMALLNNTMTYKLPETIDLIPVMFTQKVSLKKQNIEKDFNVKQWNNITKHFNLK
ncbi:glycosyl transferase [Neptunitalea chrysea]|uniref:Glycosyl transferase n=1 Tax=Neptunitalea chrysea TaxID=1647581 RepID=A0A9W6B8B4_9FLAO|nr:glycosyltransferase family A protein [Neptunitalea chrysea]GLB53565.1 glycosyl transferase [Neptunitalea chrysea]